VLNRAILTAGDPEGDVLFGVDSNLLGRALAEDLFIPYESPLLEHVPEHLRVDEHVTPIDVGDVCLNTDLAYFEDKDLAAPDSLDDLVDPAYAGLTVVEDPSTSSPGLAFLLATVAQYGDDWEQWWADLRANDVLVESGWESAYYGAFSGGSGEGDRPIVVSYASSPAAEVFFSEGALTEAPTGVVTSSCFGQVEYAGILRGTGNEPAARALVDFLLSPEVQADIPLQMFVYPVRDDVALPEVFADHAAQVAEPLTMDPIEIDAQREALIARWTEVVLR
jgi:thiamine transport system substrate-binding protein